MIHPRLLPVCDRCGKPASQIMTKICTEADEDDGGRLRVFTGLLYFCNEHYWIFRKGLYDDGWAPG